MSVPLERVKLARQSLLRSRTGSQFLTFLIDKAIGIEAGPSNIITFMKKYNLYDSIADSYFNPWMRHPYKNVQSCTATITHFKQPRKNACWNGRDIKAGCDRLDCLWHPQTSKKVIKCNFNYEAIWKRETPTNSYQLSSNYLSVLKNEILGGKKVTLDDLLLVLYADEDDINQKIMVRFKNEFNFTDLEFSELFSPLELASQPTTTPLPNESKIEVKKEVYEIQKPLGEIPRTNELEKIDILGNIIENLQNLSHEGTTVSIGQSLEEAVCDALDFLGFQAEIIGGPGKTDIVATMFDSTLIVECKNYSGTFNFGNISINVISHIDEIKQNPAYEDTKQFFIVLANSFSPSNLNQLKQKIENLRATVKIPVIPIKTGILIKLLELNMAYNITPRDVLSFIISFEKEANVVVEEDIVLFEKKLPKLSDWGTILLEIFPIIVKNAGKEVNSVRQAIYYYFEYVKKLSDKDMEILNKDIDIIFKILEHKRVIKIEKDGALHLMAESEMVLKRMLQKIMF